MILRIFTFALVFACVACTHQPVPTWYADAKPRTGPGTAMLPDGGQYRGHFADGLFHGEGVMTYADGARYNGQFRRGLAHGHGRYIYRDGGDYVGAFVAGDFHGEGRLRYADGGVYSGRFKHGKRHGFGTMSLHDNVYTGHFADDESSGTGEYIYADGSSYAGDWVASEYTGEGVYTDTDGTEYSGTFANSEANGQIRINFSNGQSYVGQAADWQPQGAGIYVDDDGTTWTGEFDGWQLEGLADVLTEAGDRYAGSVSNWRYHGEGTLQKSAGEHYAGGFEYGVYSGTGALTLADGKYYEGEFASGRFHGRGTLAWTDAAGQEQRLSGPWRHGYFTGPGRHLHIATGLALPDGEELLYQQPERLRAAINALPDSDPTDAQMFVVTFAPYGDQDVFMLEAQLAQSVFAERFDAGTRTVELVNNLATINDKPLATTANLKHALIGISSRMQHDKDVLLLFLTSHGAKDRRLAATLPGASLQDLTSEQLRGYLDGAGIRSRVVVISACYSGGFMTDLADQNTLVITSARADRTSFGCSDDADLTFFGRAFLETALPSARSFEDAFFTARKLVTARELEEGYTPSEPQFHPNSGIEHKLTNLMRPAPVAPVTIASAEE